MFTKSIRNGEEFFTTTVRIPLIFLMFILSSDLDTFRHGSFNLAIRRWGAHDLLLQGKGYRRNPSLSKTLDYPPQRLYY